METSTSYYYARTVDLSMEDAETRVRETLAEEGFGILTEIDIQATMKKKLDVDMKPYKILGACNPPAAYQALQAEDKIGTMLPCNVILQRTETGTEIAAVDPVASMQAVNNQTLADVASDIRDRLRTALDNV